MKRATFKYIERELYDYHDSLKQIELLRKNIILQSEHKEKRDENVGASRTNSNVSVVESAVSRLQRDKRLQHLESITGVIRQVYNESDEIMKKIIDLRYWTKPRELDWNGISVKVNVSRATALRHRNNFMVKCIKMLKKYNVILF